MQACACMCAEVLIVAVPQILSFFIACATMIYSTVEAGAGSREMFGNGKGESGLDDDAVPYR